jgi:nucleoside-diphosphate-sugar epimerase
MLFKTKEIIEQGRNLSLVLSIQVLKACRDAKVQRVVYYSTSEVYG